MSTSPAASAAASSSPVPARAARPASDEETPYDVFVSYARRDNATGWVSALHRLLTDEAPLHLGGQPLRVFFDVDEIHGMDDWTARLQGALRRSRLLLVCASPAWLASPYCRLEWRLFQQARAGRRTGVPEGVAIVSLANAVLPPAAADTGTPAMAVGCWRRPKTEPLLRVVPTEN